MTTFFILYKIPIIRYYIKYLCFFLIIHVGSLFYTLIFLIKGEPSYSNSCDILPLVHLSQIVLGLNPKHYGLENCYLYRQGIYVINHQSFIDVIAIRRLWSEPSSSIAKDSLRYFGLGWPLMHFMKILPINRNDHAKAMITMQKAAEMVKNERVNMFIFPEGTRNRSGEHLLPFKKGAFHLAIQAQLPIIPVVISSYKSFLDHKNKVFDDAAYGVYILKPIPTEGLTSADAGRLMEQTREAMSEIFELTTIVSKDDLWIDVRERPKILEQEAISSEKGEEDGEKQQEHSAEATQ
ncbi:hypothetical protein Aperf_G00000097963 [Anoplocephala perfoliata]